ncbi:hypothetical protein [uncultured Bacteroides sp.]|uniref:hypothetical protein n=1 Tax=uncultured Bacteroides sp. TaxID=162156 RepID=UPI002AAC3D17|nr:hypothetical protein [uncultured Bacteroides sp.]
MLLSVSLFLVSCGDQQAMENLKTSDLSTASTRAFSADEPSVSNPALQTDWENVKIIKLNGPGNMEIDAPWVYKEGNSMNIPLSYCQDIKKEDGWTMLSHTMIRQNMDYPNYMLFYNKYTGILKGFYYNLQNINNQTFIWTLNAKSPTSIFCSNTLIQEPMTATENYTTSSNIVEVTPLDYGQLNYGWNCFSFELCYSPMNNAPIVSIEGFNTETSIFNLSGDYSGEVIIPINVKKPSGLKSLVSGIGKIVGMASAIIPQLSTVSTAISAASAIMGHTSLYKSKTNMTTIRATSSGKIKLTGTSFTSKKGALTTANNIDLKRLNNNNDLGVWNLSSTPEVNYYKCSRLRRAPRPFNSTDSREYDITTVQLGDLDLNSLIVLNPALMNDIASYRIVKRTFFSQSPSLFTSLASASKYYPTNLGFYIAYSRPFYSEIERMMRYYVVKDSSFFDEILLSITIEISYKNGSTVLSSRVFKPNFKCIDNMNDIKQSNRNAYFVYLTPTPEGPSEY